MKYIAAIPLLVLLSVPAVRADVFRDRQVIALGVVHATVAYADAAQTLAFLKHPGTREANPLVRPFVHSSAAYYAMTTAEVALSAFVADRMRRSSRGWIRKMWWLPQTTQIGAHAWGIAYTWGNR